MSHRLEPGEIKFEFDVGTNLNPQVNGHAHDLTYQIIDKDTCVRIGSVPFRRSSRSSCRQDESRSTIVDVQQPTGTWTATNPVMSHESAETSLRFNASASQANEVRDVDHEIEGDVTISDGHDSSQRGRTVTRRLGSSTGQNICGRQGPFRMIAVRYAMPAAWCSHMLARELAGFQTICCKQSGSPMS